MLAGLLVTALLLQQPAPAPSAADDDYVRDAFIRRLDYVIFHQPIDDENVERVARLLQPGDILDLQSQGGTVRASLRFGELVMDRVIRVRVTGLMEVSSTKATFWRETGVGSADSASNESAPLRPSATSDAPTKRGSENATPTPASLRAPPPTWASFWTWEP